MSDTKVILAPERLGGQVPARLQLLFLANLTLTSDSPVDAVVPGDAGDGAYIGTGSGTVKGERLSGVVSWSLYAGNCLYPRIRAGQTVSDELNLCTLNPGGFIDTYDGSRLRFEGRGYGLRSPERYLMSATLTFRTDAVQYTWLNKVLAVMEAEFDEKAGLAVWNVSLPHSVLAR